MLDSHLRFIEVERRELGMREGMVGVISPEEAFLEALKAYIESAYSLPIYCWSIKETYQIIGH